MASKSPIEPMVSHTPMSASEGGLILLVGGALIGVGYLIGTAKVWKAKLDESLAQPRRRPRENRDHQGNQNNQPHGSAKPSNRTQK